MVCQQTHVLLNNKFIEQRGVYKMYIEPMQQQQQNAAQHQQQNLTVTNESGPADVVEAVETSEVAPVVLGEGGGVELQW